MRLSPARLVIGWILAALLFTGHSPRAQESFEGLDAYIEQTMKDWKVPGLAISVIKDGEVVYAKGYGCRDLACQHEVTTKTLFSMASATKSFTSTVAAMLVDDGKIDWDTPLRNYLPEFRLFDPMATEKVTLRDMLCHRTGVGRQEFYELNVPADRQKIRQALSCFEPNSDFRSMWQYSNWCYAVAGDILGFRAGMPWEDLVRQRIFDPLQMTSSVFSVTDMQKSSDFARPHIIYDEEPERMTFYNADSRGASGSIVSNVEDISKWIIFHLNKGKQGDAQLVGQKILAVTQTPHIPVPIPKKYPEKFYQSYGLGWFVDNYRGYVHIHHGGVLYGFTSLVSFLPEQNIGLVVLANLNGTPLTTILEGYVYDRLLGLDPVNWNERYLDSYRKMKERYEKMEAMGDPDRREGTRPSHPLTDYAGMFRNEGYGDITIIAEGDSLQAIMTTDTYPLRHYHYDIFDLYHPVKKMGWKTAFRTNGKGQISSFGVEIEPGLKEVVFVRVESPASKAP